MSTHAADTPATVSAARRWLVTLAVMAGAISTVLASTIVNVAMPDMMGAFGMGQDQGQWLSTGFLAAMTATMLVAAWSLQRFGLRATYAGAMAIFVLASVAGGLSANPAELIAMRVLQGAAAGLVQPLTMVALFQVFPPEKRGTAMGVFGLGVVLAPALGPTLGGILIDLYSWRVVFFVVLPSSFAAIALALAYLPGRKPGTPVRPFDLAGFLLLCGALVLLLTGLANGRREGWDSGYILSLLGSGTLLSVLFVYWQTRCAHPLLELSLLRFRVFSASCVVAFIYGAGLFGSTYLVPQFAQGIQQLTPEGVGLMLLPSGLMLALVFPIAGRASDRISNAVMVTVGLAIFGLSSLWMKDVDVNTPFWLLAAWIAVGRIGLGFILPALNAGGVRALPHASLAQGSGVLNFMRQLGGAFGVNLLSVLLGERIALHSNALAATQDGSLTVTNDWIELYKHVLAQGGVPDGLLQKYGALHHLGRTLYLQAATLSFRDSFIAVALIFFAGMIPAMTLRARKAEPGHALPAREPAAPAPAADAA